jgi:hypothetical protein
VVSPAVSSRLRWLAVAAVYVGITLAYARPLLPVIGSALPNDTGDPGLNTWILWWNAQAIPLTTTWWNGGIFFPAPGAMALSETFLNLWPLSTPMQWAGASAVLTYNVMYLLSFPAAALAAHALAHRLTGRHDAAFVAGLAFGFAPYRAAQMPHLQTLWSCWMPLGLYFLHRFVRHPGPEGPGLHWTDGAPDLQVPGNGHWTDGARDLQVPGNGGRWNLVGFGLCWLLNGLSTGYYLFYFSALVGLWMLWFARSIRDWVSIGVAAIIASLPLAPLLMGYQRFQSAFGLARTMQEIEFFSADLSAMWATTPYVWPHRWTLEPGPEGELYPGATILALTIIGAVVVWFRLKPGRRYRAQPWLLLTAGALATATYRAWNSGGWSHKILGLSISLTRPAKAMFLTLCVSAVALAWNPKMVDAWRRRSTFLFYAIASVMMLLFALGPQAHFLKTTFLYEAPYYWLMQLPGGHAFRVPARFAMLFSLCLAVAASLAFSRLARSPARPLARLAALIVCAAVLFEGFVFEMGVAKMPPSVDFAGLDRGSVLLELPMSDEYTDTAAMLRATQSGHILVNGFSGYTPPHYNLMKEGFALFDESVLRALQQYGPLLVFVHQERDDNNRYRDLIENLPDAHRVLTGASGSLYQLPTRVRDTPATARQLPVASVRATAGPQLVPGMLDGDLTTRWQTPTHQTSGDQITITFDQPVMVSRLEMALGRFKDDYPRKLRITMGEPGAPPVTIWDSRTTGLAMMAVLTDRPRMPLVFNFTRHVSGRELVLTVVDGHMDFSWSIAELKVFGD